jgi:hypothetical protein
VARRVPILVSEEVLEQAVADAASGAGGVPDIGPEHEPDDEDDDA